MTEANMSERPSPYGDKQSYTQPEYQVFLISVSIFVIYTIKTSIHEQIAFGSRTAKTNSALFSLVQI